MNFSQTCSLLSQYLKENKGSFFPDLNLNLNLRGLDAPTDGVATAKTMDLFPQQSGSGTKDHLPNKPDFSVQKSESGASSQMTIFYNGQVIVFNDFPADKAKELMLLASKSSSVSNTTCTSLVQIQKPVEPTNVVPPTNSTVSNSTIVNSMIQDRAQGPTKAAATDLPIARKASLTRFLEKRKDRITARAPYAKPEQPKSWLGLAAQGPAHLERLIQDKWLDMISRNSRAYLRSRFLPF